VWHQKFRQIFLFSSFLGYFYSSYPTLAQIIPDKSLGNERSIVTPNVTVKDALADLIEGGAIRDNNLFHSFSEFNVSEGGRVYFANPDRIANILTRVTGNKISEIFGTLGVDGAANLFLLNPNGIVFGKNASLDVNGSFLATTAESFVFGNGLEFSATNPETAPLLTVNLTTGLQMGSNSGSIAVQGEGHLLTGGFATPLGHNNNPKGLQVKSGKTLGLIGKEINLDGGTLRIPGGNIQLSSVEEGIVNLAPNIPSWRLDTSQVQKFGDIKLSNQALLDTSGFITGDINLQGRNIDLEDGSVVMIQNFGNRASGGIAINATDTLRIAGSVRNAPEIVTPLGNITGVVSSRLSTEAFGIGKGGNIDVSSGNLSLVDGGWIAARSYSQANTGDFKLDVAKSIEINGYSFLNPSISSGIYTTIFDRGDGGEVFISARNIIMLDGGVLVSANFGSGKGSDIQINVADDLTINGFNPEILSATNIGNSVFRTGNSGNLTINVARLSLNDRGIISNSTFAEGNAGTLRINASESIKIQGIGDRDSISVLNSIIASDAPILDLILRQVTGLPDRPSGNSGNLIINTPSLSLTDGGSITVRNEGLGNSGSLSIDSDRIFLDNKSIITGFSASGRGGNLDLDIKDSLLLRNSSTITAEATGTLASDYSSVNGGNINIDADLITLLEKSSINANAFEGNGGNINLKTVGLFVSPDSLISASSQYGLVGNVNIENVNSGRHFKLNQLPQNPVDATKKITRGCGLGNDFAVVGNGGLPENPTQTSISTNVWTDTRVFTNPEITKLKTFSHSSKNNQTQREIVEAQNWKINDRGQIELFSVTNNDRLPKNSATCS
jgi:filamentous hemagglutinin family protein